MWFNRPPMARQTVTQQLAFSANGDGGGVAFLLVPVLALDPRHRVTTDVRAEARQ
jgi:hypothetical protein